MKITFVIMDCIDDSTFERCVQSINLQTISDYEILVVGTRSEADITADGITAKYITCEDDICIMLEAALDHAKGEYICFIDSIHCYSPFFGEKMSDICAYANFAGCGYVGIQQNTLLSQVGVPLMMYRPETMPATEYAEKLTGGDVVSVEMHNYFENKLFSRNLLEKCRPLAKDSSQLANIVKKLTENCETVAVTDEPLLFVCIE